MIRLTAYWLFSETKFDLLISLPLSSEDTWTQSDKVKSEFIKIILRSYSLQLLSPQPCWVKTKAWQEETHKFGSSGWSQSNIRWVNLITANSATPRHWVGEMPASYAGASHQANGKQVGDQRGPSGESPAGRSFPQEPTSGESTAAVCLRTRHQTSLHVAALLNGTIWVSVCLCRYSWKNHVIII